MCAHVPNTNLIHDGIGRCFQPGQEEELRARGRGLARSLGLLLPPLRGRERRAANFAVNSAQLQWIVMLRAMFCLGHFLRSNDFFAGSERRCLGYSELGGHERPRSCQYPIRFGVSLVLRVHIRTAKAVRGFPSIW